MRSWGFSCGKFAANWMRWIWEVEWKKGFLQLPGTKEFKQPFRDLIVWPTSLSGNSDWRIPPGTGRIFSYLKSGLFFKWSKILTCLDKKDTDKHILLDPYRMFTWDSSIHGMKVPINVEYSLQLVVWVNLKPLQSGEMSANLISAVQKKEIELSKPLDLQFIFKMRQWNFFPLFFPPWVIQ